MDSTHLQNRSSLTRIAAWGREHRTYILEASSLIASQVTAVAVYGLSVGYTFPRLFENSWILFLTSCAIATWILLAIWIHFFLMIVRDPEVPESLKIPFGKVSSHLLEKLRNENLVTTDGNTANAFDKLMGRTCSWRPCFKCETFVPRRARHCVHCNRCSFGRDHHCFVAKTCIGERNHVNFLGYLFYAAIGALCASAFGFLLVYRDEGSECWCGFLKSCYIFLYFFFDEFSFYKCIILNLFVLALALFWIFTHYLLRNLKNRRTYVARIEIKSKIQGKSSTFIDRTKLVGANPLLGITIPVLLSPYHAQYDSVETFAELLQELEQEKTNEATTAQELV